jgi:SAM-dependent methyltransferase
VTTAIQTAQPGYVFADDPARDRNGHHGELVAHLAAILDPFTIRRLAPLVSPTTRCLEVGAGAGTIAGWLADRAGAVTATDLDPSPIPDHPNLRAIRHDIRTDPLEPGQWDLIHCRLVLGHIGTRRLMVDKLAAALAPGGALVIEEFDASWDRCLMHAPDPAADRLFAGYQHALTSVLTAAGTDPRWGRSVYKVMHDAGLVEVDTEFWARAWHGGEPGCLLPYTAAAQLRPKLIEAGMSSEDIDAFRALLVDPRLVIYGNLAVSTCGRRP